MFRLQDLKAELLTMGHLKHGILYYLDTLALKYTLGFLPKIPFKLTQSIHVAIQKKTAILTKNCQNYSVFNTKTNKGNIGLYFENVEKNC